MLGIAPVLPAARSFEELAVPGGDRPIPLFVLSIEHIPLA